MKLKYIVKNVNLGSGEVVTLQLQHSEATQLKNRRRPNPRESPFGLPFRVVQIMDGSSFQEHDYFSSTLIVTLQEYQDMGSPTIGNVIVFSTQIAENGVGL